MKKLKKKKFDLFEEMRGKPFYVLLHYFVDAEETPSTEELNIIRGIAENSVSKDPKFDWVLEALSEYVSNEFDLWLELCDKPLEQLVGYLQMMSNTISPEVIKVLRDIANFNYNRGKIDDIMYDQLIHDLDRHDGGLIDT